MKGTAKVKPVKKNDTQAMIKELEEKLQGMVEDRDKKCKAAKEQLIDMLDVTVDKYRTATGTAEALRVLRFAKGNDDASIMMANTLAYDMADEALNMKKKAEGLGYAEMDELCNGFYEQRFILGGGEDDVAYYYSLAFEMMRIDLCRNVGGAAEDMVEFIKRVEQDIEDTKKALDELKVKED